MPTLRKCMYALFLMFFSTPVWAAVPSHKPSPQLDALVYSPSPKDFLSTLTQHQSLLSQQTILLKTLLYQALQRSQQGKSAPARLPYFHPKAWGLKLTYPATLSVWSASHHTLALVSISLVPKTFLKQLKRHQPSILITSTPKGPYILTYIHNQSQQIFLGLVDQHALHILVRPRPTHPSFSEQQLISFTHQMRSSASLQKHLTTRTVGGVRHVKHKLYIKLLSPDRLLARLGVSKHRRRQIALRGASLSLSFRKGLKISHQIEWGHKTKQWTALLRPSKQPSKLLDYLPKEIAWFGMNRLSPLFLSALPTFLLENQWITQTQYNQWSIAWMFSRFQTRLMGIQLLSLLRELNGDILSGVRWTPSLAAALPQMSRRSVHTSYREGVFVFVGTFTHKGAKQWLDALSRMGALARRWLPQMAKDLTLKRVTSAQEDSLVIQISQDQPLYISALPDGLLFTTEKTTRTHFQRARTQPKKAFLSTHALSPQQMKGSFAYIHPRIFRRAGASLPPQLMLAPLLRAVTSFSSQTFTRGHTLHERLELKLGRPSSSTRPTTLPTSRVAYKTLRLPTQPKVKGLLIMSFLTFPLALPPSLFVTTSIPAYLAWQRQRKRRSAQSEACRLRALLQHYREQKDRYPMTQEGLQVLVREGLLQELPKDPWGRLYVYRFPGIRDPARPDVYSLNQDGKEGGLDASSRDLLCPPPSP